MIQYPIKNKDNKFSKLNSNANKGMALEEMINISNERYLNNKIAFINKRPISIKILKSEARYHILDAYFMAPSTLDYVGVYQGKYLDFEAKETISKKGFPMENISEHQIKAMEHIKEMGGITFAIIFLKAKNEIYLLDASYLIQAFNNKEKFISYEKIKEVGHLIKEGYLLPIDYLKIVKEIYL